MFGSHLSIAGAMANALREAEGLGLECVQVFTKNQQQWSAPPLKPEAVAEWEVERARLGWAPAVGGPERTVSHASYLANLGSPDEALRTKSIGMIREELARCETLGIGLLVMHPGAFTTSTLEEGRERVATACADLLRGRGGAGEVGAKAVTLCLENVAGAGTTMGRRFEDLAWMRERIVGLGVSPERIGICFDTCHAHAAGYDLSDRAKAKAAVEELERVCGEGVVRVLHLNDSKGAAGSRLDRHEHIGKGTIGVDGFSAVVRHEEWLGLPKILETPKGVGPGRRAWDEINVAVLRGLLGGAETRGRVAQGSRRAGVARKAQRPKGQAGKRGA